MINRVLYVLVFLAVSSAFGAFTVIENGSANGKIVIPADARGVELKAAEELQVALAKSTGVTMQIVRENDAAAANTAGYFLGRTAAAKQAGLDYDSKAPNSFKIKYSGNRLFIVGKNDAGGEVDMNVSAGTLFGVYRYLIRTVGFRWLWPGKTGEYVPEHKILSIDSSADCEISNQLRTRIPHDMWSPAVPELRQWARRVFNLCSHETMKIAGGDGHIFDRYVGQYAKAHPAWFAMLPDGTRKTIAPTSVCLSNPEFQNEMLKNWKALLDAEKKTNPNARVMLNLQRGDVELNCVCKNCTALDGEDFRLSPRNYRDFRNVGERYARVAVTLYDRMQQLSPGGGGVWLLAYQSSLYAPREVKLNPDFQVKLVMDVPFPRRPEYTREVRNEYLQWKKSGATLTLRPNYFQGGYCMPELWYDEFADELNFLRDKCGIVRFDLDGPPQMWSIRGINTYIACRMAAEPGTTVEELFQEYCSGFGPAAKEVAEYLRYWRNYVKRNTSMINDAHEKLSRMGWDFFGFDYPGYVHKVYPAAELRKAVPLLEKAAKAAGGDAAAAAKVNFLRQGLENAIRTVETAEVFADVTSSTAERQAAYAKLQAFRKTLPEHAVDHGYLNRNEKRVWKFVNNIPKDAVLLPENWRVCPDPENVGQKKGWHRKDFSYSSWKMASTWKGLRPQGYSDYIHMWYRTSITLPPEYASEKAFLVLGAVDEDCKIWINGRTAGGFISNFKIDPGSWNRPFRIEITDFVQYGKPMEICVRITKRSQGLGGIWKASWIELKNRLNAGKERKK